VNYDYATKKAAKQSRKKLFCGLNTLDSVLL